MSILRTLRRAGLALAGALAALLLALTVAGALYVPELTPPPGLESGRIETPLGSIRYARRGAGPDVLLIHGCPGSLEDWEAVALTLSATHRVTAYDRPGHGYSGDAPAGGTHAAYTYESSADAALAVIDALDLKDVVVAGHSYGATTALALALRRPAKVRAIVPVDGAAYRWLSAPDPIYRVLVVPWLGTGVARAIGSLVGPGKIRAGFARSFATPPPEEFTALRTRIWTQAKVTRSIAAEVLGAQPGLDALAPRYPEIRLPVVVVGQTADPARREAAERLAREVPGARLRLVEGTGHFVQVERPEAVVAAIAEAGAAR